MTHSCSHSRDGLVLYHYDELGASARAELRIGDGGGMIQIRLLSGQITIDNE